ncbi:lysostaphin resistance A-like protein [Marinicella sp. W31]|uniref:CPBP family intramembrane glutamic endopeptidase n=1 Tax=Marinicella sp. W31 TaxID=3023713 RepID=UPI003756C285
MQNVFPEGRYILIVLLMPFLIIPWINPVLIALNPHGIAYWDEVIITYTYQLVSILTLLLVMFLHKTSWQHMFQPFAQERLWPAVQLTLFILVFSIAAAFVLFYPLSFLFPDFVQGWYLDIPPIIYLDGNDFPIVANVLSFSSIVIITPVFEEFVFRGLLLHRWRDKWNLKKAAMVSSVLFGLLHFDPIGATAFGLAMCYLYVKSGSLWLPIVCHMLNNLIAWLIELAYITFDEDYGDYSISDFQSEWYIGVAAILVVVVWIWYYMKRPSADKASG